MQRMRCCREETDASSVRLTAVAALWFGGGGAPRRGCGRGRPIGVKRLKGEATAMETATWVIAGASIVNIIVLVMYAFFTWGIWRETRQGGRRTEELARQARDALWVQIGAILFQVREEALSRGRREPGDKVSPGREERAVKRLMRAVFGREEPQIESIWYAIYRGEEE